jgi:hypothetical protein
VRAWLTLLGWKSVSQWAEAMGYKNERVHVVIKKIASEQPIYGAIEAAIAKDLDTTLAQGITPDVFLDATALPFKGEM